jgi:hypothetical protein
VNNLIKSVFKILRLIFSKKMAEEVELEIVKDVKDVEEEQNVP